MGKAEQFKLERKMQEIQQRVQNTQKQYRNKVFAAGFVSGLLATALVFSLFIVGSNNKQITHDLPKISTGSGTLSSPIALPSNLTLPQGPGLTAQSPGPNNGANLQLGQ